MAIPSFAFAVHPSGIEAVSRGARPGGGVAEGGLSAEPYPVFLRLAGRRVVVVGGGRVAAGKVPGLLEAGARVSVVAEVIGAELRLAALAPTSHAGALAVSLIERAFEPADLDGASFVVAAAPPEVNRAVAVAAEARGLFVNAVDDAASASALLGGVVRRGGLTVAVSTGGRAPALAGLLREALEAVLPDDLEAWVSLGERVRAQWKRDGLPLGDRRPLLLRALIDLYAGKDAERSPGLRTATAELRASKEVP